MGVFRTWQSRCAISIVLFSALTVTTAALASQGPGGGLGTASPSTQLIMAIVVYGSAAMLVVAALIGALKRKF